MKAFLIFVTMGLTLLCTHANAACAPDLRTHQGVATALVKLGYLQSGTIQPATLTSAVQTFQTQSGIASDGVRIAQPLSEIVTPRHWSLSCTGLRQPAIP